MKLITIFIISMIIISGFIIVYYSNQETEYNFGSFSIDKVKLNSINDNFNGQIYQLCSFKENKCVLVQKIQELKDGS